MPHQDTTTDADPQDKGNAALKALIAIAVKAGSSTVALPPAGGWPSAIGVPLRSWQRALSVLEADRLVEQVDGAILLLQALTQEDIEEGERFVRLPRSHGPRRTCPRMLFGHGSPFSPLPITAPGRGRALLPAIARRMGRTRAAASRALAKLESLGIFHRASSRSWTVATAPHGSRHGMIGLGVLREHFDFDRPTSTATNMENVIVFPSTARTNSAESAENSRHSRNDDTPLTQHPAPLTQRSAPLTQRHLSTSPIQEPYSGTMVTASAAADAAILTLARVMAAQVEEQVEPVKPVWTAQDWQRLFRRAS